MPDAPPLDISCADLKARLDDNPPGLLLDCRETDEYEVVHIESATLLPMSEIMQRVDELEPHKSDDIIVYCHHGGRSQQVAMWLRQQGYEKAQSLAGGVDQWAIEIDPSLPRY